MPRWRDIKHKKIKQKSIKIEDNIKYAHILDRIKAFLTDTFMITTPILYIVIYLIMGSREEFRAHMGRGWLYIVIFHYIIVVSLWIFKSQTPGMKAYDIKIVSKNLKKINIIQATIRYFLMPISILSIIGLLIAFFRKDRQTLHDILSFTLMVGASEKK